MTPRRDLTTTQKIDWYTNEIEQASKMAAYFAKLRLRHLTRYQYERASRLIDEREKLKAEQKAEAEK